MDIVDIDEVLKDDSFCLMGEKGQDDVTNILQQWKINLNTQQGTKLDTRTFTRPKRKPTRNSETFCLNDSTKPYTILNADNSIDLQIGGLVTNIPKNSLQDISPPSSICSSMDLSTDRMNNSLITSADFTNVSFFKTTNLDDLLIRSPDDLLIESNSDEEKVLEDLSLSGDSALMKDLNIAQIDEVNLRKTFNDNDIMFNSTNSELNTHDAGHISPNKAIVETRTSNSHVIDSSEEYLKESGSIQNTTFNLSDNTQVFPESQLNSNILNMTVNLSSINGKFTADDNPPLNMTFEKESNSDELHKTFVRTESCEENSTFYQELHKENETCDKAQIFASDSKIKRCKTPENDFIYESDTRDLQSTPLQKVSYKNTNPKASLKNVINENVLLSPIAPEKATSASAKSRSREVNNKLVEELDTYIGNFTENGKNLKKTTEIAKFNKENEVTKERKIPNSSYLGSDVELFSKDKNQDEFENMLKHFGRTFISEESNKMRQSLDNIRKRHSLISDKFSNDTIKPTTFVNNSCTSSSSNERLLSKRGRLYDEVSLEKLQSATTSLKEKKTDLTEKYEDKTTPENFSTAENLNNVQHHDRFRTIRIVKKLEDISDNESGKEVKDSFARNPDIRFNRHDKNLPTLISNNKNEEERNSFIKYRQRGKIVDGIRDGSTEIHYVSDNTKQKPSSKTQNISYTNNDPSAKENSTGEFEKSLSDNCPTKESNHNDLSQLTGKGLLGVKAKSYQNLSSQFGFARPHSQLSGPYNGKKKKDETLFKVPHAISVRSTSNNRKSGLVRPSSGFYSYNVNKVESEIENSRHSSSNSLSSTSSKGSVQEIQRKAVNDLTDSKTEKVQECVDIKKRKPANIKSNIPKPSGLRPPAIKKSILPLPSSMIKR